MGKNPGDPYVIPIVIALLIVSFPFGLFPWAAASVVGLAAIQAGLHGFRSAGYEIVGHSRLTGSTSRIIGGIMIAVGLAWEVSLIGFLIHAIFVYR